MHARTHARTHICTHARTHALIHTHTHRLFSYDPSAFEYTRRAGTRRGGVIGVRARESANNSSFGPNKKQGEEDLDGMRRNSKRRTRVLITLHEFKRETALVTTEEVCAHDPSQDPSEETAPLTAAPILAATGETHARAERKGNVRGRLDALRAKVSER
eukprot:2868573-Pleurochrysis_carterae.AAC.1